MKNRGNNLKKFLEDEIVSESVQKANKKGKILNSFDLSKAIF